MTLTQIFDTYKTDKGSLGHGAEIHNYGLAYEQFFEEFRGNGISICELGVLDGNSLRSWRDYFENARVLGVDNADYRMIDGEDGFTTILGDQGNPIELKEMIGDGWDIIIDDGSHLPKHQQECLYHLINNVKSGGYYVIEDLHTKRMNWEEWQIFEWDGSTNSTWDFVESQLSKSYYLTEDQISEILGKIDEVGVYEDKMVVIKVK